MHVWSVPLNKFTHLVPLFSKWLTAGEMSQSERMVSLDHRRLFILRRGLLRVILSGYLSILPQECQFVKGDHGKPRLMDHHDLHFNVSESCGLAVYGIHKKKELGIDVEKIRPIAGMLQMVDRFFFESERLKFNRLSEKDAVIAFFNTWTRKESYLKQTGEGLAKIRDIEVTLGPSEVPCVLSICNDREKANGFTLKSFQPKDTYTAAICFQNGSLQPKMKYFQFDNVVRSLDLSAI